MTLKQEIEVGVAIAIAVLLIGATVLALVTSRRRKDSNEA